jgi:hypothetical protein
MEGNILIQIDMHLLKIFMDTLIIYMILNQLSGLVYIN